MSTESSDRDVAVAFTFYEGGGTLSNWDDGWRLALHCHVEPSPPNWMRGGVVDGRRAEIADVVGRQPSPGVYVFAISFPDGEPDQPEGNV